jgi:hypothetical protein
LVGRFGTEPSNSILLLRLSGLDFTTAIRQRTEFRRAMPYGVGHTFRGLHVFFLMSDRCGSTEAVLRALTGPGMGTHSAAASGSRRLS